MCDEEKYINIYINDIFVKDTDVLHGIFENDRIDSISNMFLFLADDKDDDDGCLFTGKWYSREYIQKEIDSTLHIHIYLRTHSLILSLTRFLLQQVIAMHGVGSDAGEMKRIGELIDKTHNGTIFTSLPLYENSPGSWDSPLNVQVEGVVKAIRDLINKNPEAYKDGYHLVCKSQGALTCRAVIQSMDDHNVKHFVSLAGPQVGVYGQAYFEGLKKYLPSWIVGTTASLMYLVAYTALGQLISDGNMWHDPYHVDDFMKHDTFLPRFTYTATNDMRDNFVRLERAVFCVGSGFENGYDGGIEPWQTAVFGFPDEHGNILNMTQQPFYVNDTFGLRTLHETGRLNLTIVPGVTHNDWTGNDDVILKYVLPHCT